MLFINMVQSRLHTKKSLGLDIISQLSQDGELLLDIKVGVDYFYTNEERLRIELIRRTPNLDY